AEDGIRDKLVTGVQTCALPISLTATPSSSDADGDTVTYGYQWKKNGTAISGATSSTLDLSAAGHGDKGDAITVAVTPNDGSVDRSEERRVGKEGMCRG